MKGKNKQGVTKMNLERIKTLNPNVELLIVRETLEGVEKLFNKNGLEQVITPLTLISRASNCPAKSPLLVT